MNSLPLLRWRPRGAKKRDLEFRRIYLPLFPVDMRGARACMLRFHDERAAHYIPRFLDADARMDSISDGRDLEAVSLSDFDAKATFVRYDV